MMTTTENTLDSLIKRILNDPEIFESPFDKTVKTPMPLLFPKETWEELKATFEKGDYIAFNSLVDNRLQSLRHEAQISPTHRKEHIGKLLSLGESIKTAYYTKHNLLTQLFSLFESFGLLKCNLPDMEDYGEVIENHPQPIVEQFFLYKINKEREGYRKRALKKTLDYVKELYAIKTSALEIAFFIRKLESLTEFVEVIKNE